MARARSLLPQTGRRTNTRRSSLDPGRTCLRSDKVDECTDSQLQLLQQQQGNNTSDSDKKILHEGAKENCKRTIITIPHSSNVMLNANGAGVVPSE